ncbi:MAG: helix-turn-helix domain-containing protein [Solirubrobacterales bacterium]|nr:helix-turn-helix domain-containing protein [Solirubrobacterales bacterium]
MPRRREPQPALGHVIYGRRKELGLSQETVALAAGTDQARMSRIETAGDNPSLASFERIADALELEPWELLKRVREHQAQEEAAAAAHRR